MNPVRFLCIMNLGGFQNKSLVILPKIFFYSIYFMNGNKGFWHDPQGTVYELTE